MSGTSTQEGVALPKAAWYHSIRACGTESFRVALSRHKVQLSAGIQPCSRDKCCSWISIIHFSLALSSDLGIWSLGNCPPVLTFPCSGVQVDTRQPISTLPATHTMVMLPVAAWDHTLIRPNWGPELNITPVFQ